MRVPTRFAEEDTLRHPHCPRDALVEHTENLVKRVAWACRHREDHPATGGILPQSPATSVEGPKYSQKLGKTPVLDADQARELLDSIDTSTIVGLRDHALIGLMVYSFARVGAVVAMKGEDYYQDGKRWSFRLHEKGGKLHVFRLTTTPKPMSTLTSKLLGFVRRVPSPSFAP